jgi:hypothetical protein
MHDTSWCRVRTDYLLLLLVNLLFVCLKSIRIRRNERAGDIHFSQSLNKCQKVEIRMKTQKHTL